MKKNIHSLNSFLLFISLIFWSASVWAWPTESEHQQTQSYWLQAKSGVGELCRLYGKSRFNGETGLYTCGESTRILGGYLKASGYHLSPVYSRYDDHTFLVHKELDEGEKVKTTIIDPTYKQFLYEAVGDHPEKIEQVKKLNDVYIGRTEGLKKIFEVVTGDPHHKALRIWESTWNSESLDQDLQSNLQATLTQIETFSKWHQNVLTPSYVCTKLYQMIRVKKIP